MRITSVIGNRPQFIKAAAVSRRLREHARRDAGPHRAALRRRDVAGVLRGAGRARRRTSSSASARARTPTQTARMLAALEPVLAESRPDLVLVYGDTNSTLAGALAAAQAQLPLAHVEAGMRSFDRAMPEELNRVLTDHVSDLLLLLDGDRGAEPRERVRGRRKAPGRRRDGGRVARVRADRGRALARARGRAGDGRASYLLVTAHRAGNVDDPERLERLVALLERLDGCRRVPAPPAHGEAARRGRAARARWRRPRPSPPPLGYLDFLELARNARAVLTDSGGVQKEAYLLGTPCVTLRDTTEWVETVEAGWNVLVDLDADAALSRARAPHAGGRAARAVRRRARGRAHSRRARFVHCRSHEDRGHRAGLRRPAAGGRVPRGRPRGGRRRRRPAARAGDRRGQLGHRGHPVGAAGGGRRQPDRLDPLRRPGAGVEAAIIACPRR